MQQKLILVRHGHRQDAADKYWRNAAKRPFDPPLSAIGWRQAIAAADQIAEVLHETFKEEACLLSSPFLRCLQTAEIISSTLGILFGIEPGLCERLHPRFIYGDTVTFLPQAEIERHFPHFATDHEAYILPYPPESRAQVRIRAQAAWRRIAENYAGPWILVGHGFTMKDIGLVYGGSGKLPKVGEVRTFSVEIEDDS